MTPEMFARLMNEANPKTAIMTHYTELEPESFYAAVRPLLDGNIDLISAFDSFEFNLPG